MFDFIVPESLGKSDKPCFVKCMDEHARHILVDVRVLSAPRNLTDV